MSKFNFNGLARKIKAEAGATLDTMANNAVNHFKVTNFDAEAFIDTTPKRWPPKKKPDGRRMLVKTGRGRASIQVIERGSTSRKVGTNVPYMRYHNEGTRRLPQRQFIGESKVLYDKNSRVLMSYIDRTIKSWNGR
jgi:phage gpG-like protein